MHVKRHAISASLFLSLTPPLSLSFSLARIQFRPVVARDEITFRTAPTKTIVRRPNKSSFDPEISMKRLGDCVVVARANFTANTLQHTHLHT